MLTGLLNRFFKKEGLPPMSQSQREALVDALVFAIMADGEFAEQERVALNEALANLEWDGNRELYITEAIGKVGQNKASADHALAHCRDIAARLETQQLREETYALAARLVCADGEVVDAERGLMTFFIQTFNIDSQRAVELSARAHKEYNLL